jgi:hypothetical protein
MTRTSLILSASAIIFLLSPSSAVAQEVRVEWSQMPATVQKTADEQSKGATVRGYIMEIASGQIFYEIQLTVNGHSKDVSVDPKGNILKIKDEVVLDKLPAPIRAGLQKKAGSGAIKRTDAITKHGSIVAYEAKVMTNGKKSEVQVGPEGKPLDHDE